MSSQGEQNRANHFARCPVEGFETEGSNNANGDSGTGFSATKGWDPVTGLGTPNFKLLEGLALSAPKIIVV